MGRLIFHYYFSFFSLPIRYVILLFAVKDSCVCVRANAMKLSTLLHCVSIPYTAFINFVLCILSRRIFKWIFVLSPLCGNLANITSAWTVAVNVMCGLGCLQPSAGLTILLPLRSLLEINSIQFKRFHSFARLRFRISGWILIRSRSKNHHSLN